MPDSCGIYDYAADEFIDPDPDIAGIGVIVAFTVIGTVTMLLISIKLSLEWWADLEPIHFILPPVDELTQDGKWPTLEDARRFVQSEADDKAVKQTPGRLFNVALSSTLFGLADTQFASGIAICVAAFAKRDITKYHYMICNEMAWMAVIASSGGFVTARTVYDNANIAKKGSRVALMWILTALALAVDFSRNDDIGYAEQVFTAGPWKDESVTITSLFNGLLYASTVFGLIFDTISLWPQYALLAYYYSERSLVAFYPPFDNPLVYFPSRRWRQCGGQTTIRGAARHFGAHLARFVFIFALWVPLWLGVVGLYWFTLQPVMVHLANCGFFFWGVGSTFKWRGEGRQCMKDDESDAEDKYGFGQVVALTLLISPIVANADAWYGTYRSHTAMEIKC